VGDGLRESERTQFQVTTEGRKCPLLEAMGDEQAAASVLWSYSPMFGAPMNSAPLRYQPSPHGLHQTIRVRMLTE
jgi:hypothetical protein